MMNKEDRVKLFANELNYIHDTKIREFAKRLIEDAPEYFFHVPASSSGKYHPQFDLGEGGLVRHTRCVAYFAKCFGVSHMLDQRTADMLVTCAIAHDIKKQGEGEHGKYTVSEHPTLAAHYLLDVSDTMPDVFTKDELTVMFNAIRSHMGQWGEKDGLPVPKSAFDFMLHDADYVASRKELLGFAFAPTEDVEINKEEVESNTDPGDFIIDFGKYKGKGKTIREIHEEELADISKGVINKPSTYIEWMANQEGFQMSEAQESAKKFLASYKKEPPKKIVTATLEQADDLPF